MKTQQEAEKQQYADDLAAEKKRHASDLQAEKKRCMVLASSGQSVSGPHIDVVYEKLFDILHDSYKKSITDAYSSSASSNSSKKPSSDDDEVKAFSISDPNNGDILIQEGSSVFDILIKAWNCAKTTTVEYMGSNSNDYKAVKHSTGFSQTNKQTNVTREIVPVKKSALHAPVVNKSLRRKLDDILFDSMTNLEWDLDELIQMKKDCNPLSICEENKTHVLTQDPLTVKLSRLVELHLSLIHI